ncbi:MAG: hypothetical protein ACYC6L_12740 [Anaerolineae bacterium]
MSSANPRWEAVWRQDIEIIRYELQFNKTLFVGQGIGGLDGDWFTLRRKPNGGQSRVVSKWLPERATKEDAERDLYAWLRHS